MDKLAEEIWKATLCSLVVATAVIGLARYFDQDPWWQVDQIPVSEESENNPLIYYSIVNSENETSFNASLFFMNSLQQQLVGKYGVFNDVLPGQVLSVKINIFDQAVRSPSFRLQEREIRHLIFVAREDKLEYLSSHSRLRRPRMPKALNLAAEKLASANIMKVIENYQPIGKAEAKVKTDLGELRNDNIDNFPRNVNPLANHFPFYIFLNFR